jgi:hypothetical protein
MRRLATGIGALVMLASIVDGGWQARAQSQTTTLRPRLSSDVLNFGSPERAYDTGGEFSAAGGYLQHSCAESCTEESKTITATFHTLLDGHRPLRLEVFWQVRPVFSTWPADDGEITAKLEYDVGNGWQLWEGEQYTWTKSSPNQVCPASISSNGPIACRTHNVSRALEPTQNTGVIKVRATAVARLHQCSKCTTSSQLGITLKVSDVRVIAETPTSQATPRL